MADDVEGNEAGIGATSGHVSGNGHAAGAPVVVNPFGAGKRLWRCYNAKCSDRPSIPGHDFVASAPTCDRCKTDGTNPRFAHLIVPLKIVHFDPPSHVDNIGLGFIACQTEVPVGRHRATGDPNTVNCPACRQSVAWKKAHKDFTLHVEDDYQILIDLENKMISGG